MKYNLNTPKYLLTLWVIHGFPIWSHSCPSCTNHTLSYVMCSIRRCVCGWLLHDSGKGSAFCWHRPLCTDYSLWWPLNFNWMPLPYLSQCSPSTLELVTTTAGRLRGILLPIWSIDLFCAFLWPLKWFLQRATTNSHPKCYFSTDWGHLLHFNMLIEYQLWLSIAQGVVSIKTQKEHNSINFIIVCIQCYSVVVMIL